MVYFSDGNQRTCLRRSSSLPSLPSKPSFSLPSCFPHLCLQPPTDLRRDKVRVKLRFAILRAIASTVACVLLLQPCFN